MYASLYGKRKRALIDVVMVWRRDNSDAIWLGCRCRPIPLYFSQSDGYATGLSAAAVEEEASMDLHVALV